MKLNVHLAILEFFNSTFLRQFWSNLEQQIVFSAKKAKKGFHHWLRLGTIIKWPKSKKWSKKYFRFRRKNFTLIGSVAPAFEVFFWPLSEANCWPWVNFEFASATTSTWRLSLRGCSASIRTDCTFPDFMTSSKLNFQHKIKTIFWVLRQAMSRFQLNDNFLWALFIAIKIIGSERFERNNASTQQQQRQL